MQSADPIYDGISSKSEALRRTNSLIEKTGCRHAVPAGRVKV